MAPRSMPGFLDVEIGSFCNRQCAWCPNGWHPRGKAHDVLPLRGVSLRTDAGSTEGTKTRLHGHR